MSSKRVATPVSSQNTMSKFVLQIKVVTRASFPNDLNLSLLLILMHCLVPVYFLVAQYRLIFDMPDGTPVKLLMYSL